MNFPMTGKTYDALKWVAQVFLPALAVFYIAVAPLWGFPSQEEVSGSIMALDLLLGTVLGLSSQAYKTSEKRFDGEVVIDESLPSGVKSGSVQLKNYADPSDVVNQDALVLKVTKTQSRDEDDFDVPS